MKSNSKETLVMAALVIIAILLLNPFNFWMPQLMVMSMLVIALVLFGVFASFILRERSIDERAHQHKSLAGRNAFLTGSGILIVGLVVQGYTHSVDAWLVYALVGMIVVKIVTRMWSDTNG